ncbi:MAG: fused DSP-PTPase phosphatase/NAD kinase-like protein [Vulcanimicrobiota bacterium]
MKLDEVLKEISQFKHFAGQVNVIDKWLAWSGAAFLSRFHHNILRIAEEDPGFALSAAKHKLEQLNLFKENWQKSQNPTGDFTDVYMGIHNIGLVDGRKIIRASQPSIADINWLARDIHLKVVINLRNEDIYWEGYGPMEEADACIENLIEHINIPLEDWDEPPPSKKQVENVLEKIDYHMTPMLIHCAEGKNRSSIVTAAYRLTKQNRSWEDVLEEAVEFGFDKQLNPNQLALMKSFA